MMEPDQPDKQLIQSGIAKYNEWARERYRYSSEQLHELHGVLITSEQNDFFLNQTFKEEDFKLQVYQNTIIMHNKYMREHYPDSSLKESHDILLTPDQEIWFEHFFNDPDLKTELKQDDFLFCTIKIEENKKYFIKNYNERKKEKHLDSELKEVHGILLTQDEENWFKYFFKDAFPDEDPTQEALIYYLLHDLNKQNLKSSVGNLPYALVQPNPTDIQKIIRCPYDSLGISQRKYITRYQYAWFEKKRKQFKNWKFNSADYEKADSFQGVNVNDFKEEMTKEELDLKLDQIIKQTLTESITRGPYEDRSIYRSILTSSIGPLTQFVKTPELYSAIIKTVVAKKQILDSHPLRLQHWFNLKRRAFIQKSPPLLKFLTRLTLSAPILLGIGLTQLAHHTMYRKTIKKNKNLGGKLLEKLTSPDTTPVSTPETTQSFDPPQDNTPNSAPPVVLPSQTQQQQQHQQEQKQQQTVTNAPQQPSP